MTRIPRSDALGGFCGHGRVAHVNQVSRVDNFSTSVAPVTPPRRSLPTVSGTYQPAQGWPWTAPSRSGSSLHALSHVWRELPLPAPAPYTFPRSGLTAHQELESSAAVSDRVGTLPVGVCLSGGHLGPRQPTMSFHKAGCPHTWRPLRTAKLPSAGLKAGPQAGCRRDPAPCRGSRGAPSCPPASGGAAVPGLMGTSLLPLTLASPRAGFCVFPGPLCSGLCLFGSHEDPSCRVRAPAPG